MTFAMAVQMDLEREYPGVIKVDGAEYVVGRSGDEGEQDAEAGGYEESSEVSVRVRVELMEDKPRRNDQWELDGVRYLVGDVGFGTGDVAWHVELIRRGESGS